jgi:maltose alpha-D-glucosyltransferase / alpha-amylase
MSERWYKEAVIYCIEVDAFQDSNGDGIGDLPGLTSRLDYLSRLGVTCLWLNPIHPTPNRDAGYDVADFYGVDSRLGSLGDFAELTVEAERRGIRIMLDLVVNHTSDQNPWFKSARSSPDSAFRDWYVWSDTEPADRREGIVFPGEQKETWTFDKQARAWYFHRFYDFQPDLNWSNPAVRAEIKKVMGFWLQLGVSGFRIDAAPFVLGLDTDKDAEKDFSILEDWREYVQWRRGDAVLLCEANVEPDVIGQYFGARPDGPNDRAHMLFSFILNTRLWLALARSDAEPLVEGLQALPRTPAMAQWATFLRNHDELDLSRLTEEQRNDVFQAFAPKPEMRLYERGIRRRIAPMLRGDRRRIEMAHSLQFSMPGTPVLRYGEEIGMGEDLTLPGRDAIRTPMQWDTERTGGFTTAPPERLARPVVSRGAFSVRKVNVRQQQREPDSLLRWFEQIIRVLRDAPEVGVGECQVMDVPLPRSVLAHRFDAPEGSILLLHNLADKPVTVDIGKIKYDGAAQRPLEVFADGPYEEPKASLSGLHLRGWGYRWIRMRRNIGHAS